MRLWDRYTARRRRKVRERYEQEKERQKALHAHDAEHGVRDTALGSAGAQQGMYGQN